MPDKVQSCNGYLCELVLQHFLWWAHVREEDVQQVARRLGVDLLLAQVDVAHFDGLGWGKAQHLL